MVHFSNGMPTDYLVYGRRTQQYYPQMNARVGGPPPRSTGGSVTYNISNNFGPPKGIMIANTIFGGLGMLGQLFLGFMGMRRQSQQVSPYAQLNQQQGLQQQQKTPNNELANLQKLFPKANIVENNGKFTATDAEGNIVGKDLSYSEMVDALGKQKETPAKPAAPNTDKPADPNAAKPADPNAAKPASNHQGSGDGNNPTVDNNSNAGGSSNVGRSSGKKGSSPGWYYAANDKSTTVQSSKGTNGGQSAQQVLSNVLGTKLTGVLNKQQQAELLAELIKKNPSVFDANGNPKTNADYSRLEVPTMDYIMNKFGLQKGQKTVRQDDQYAGKKLYECKNHDYMKKTKDGKVAYFKADGTQMSEAEFKKAHPTVNTQQAIKQHYN